MVKNGNISLRSNQIVIRANNEEHNFLSKCFISPFRV